MSEKQRFFDVFREYRNRTLGYNGLNILKANLNEEEEINKYSTALKVSKHRPEKTPYLDTFHTV